ncbi:SRPBCC domain-containing protein [Chitinophaga silvatica]|uniref:SRPBCC domain-containing protein n=1 Tax=Chitinophaga silvatica TaxID=2282649 RepID=A0A3E1Y3J6_9BACT|nr:SRPBCC domain-containing protein [Chitinophaga silvatica]RFS19270.1 SRPBCC domain-containing protein [Chitinophaga silvatica]
MKNNLIFDFSVDKENKRIVVKREFAAGLNLVWDAYTKSDILDQWWGPKPWKARTKELDLRPGGHWIYAMVGPNGEEHWSTNLFKTVNVHKNFTRIDSFSDANGNLIKDLPQSQWEVNFSSINENTLVECHIIFEELAQLETLVKMGFKEGFSQGMKQLDELLPSLK